MGTIQLLMLVPKPLEWNGPWHQNHISHVARILDNVKQNLKQNSPTASFRIADDREQTNR
jgi:hypothetical protein